MAHPDAVLINPERGVWLVQCHCNPPCCKWRCVDCGRTWTSNPDQVTCDDCGSLYVVWVNYPTWHKKRRR